MADEDVPPPGIEESEPRTTTRSRRRVWPWILLASVIAAPALIFAAWAAITLNYAYSRGDRVGYVLKISEKGWLCKTWEGELSMAAVPGVVPEKFAFTVPDDDVARRIRDLQGQQVALDYEQRKGVPTSCFGETPYHVTGVRPLAPAATTLPPRGAPIPTTTAPVQPPVSTPPAPR